MGDTLLLTKKAIPLQWSKRECSQLKSPPWSKYLKSQSTWLDIRGMFLGTVLFVEWESYACISALMLLLCVLNKSTNLFKVHYCNWKKNGTDKFGIHWHTRSKWNIKLNTDEKIYSYSYTVTTKIVYIKTFLKQHPEDVILVNHGRHLVLIIVDNTTGPGKSKGFQLESLHL